MVYKLNTIIIRLLNQNHNSFSPVALGAAQRKLKQKELGQLRHDIHQTQKHVLRWLCDFKHGQRDLSSSVASGLSSFFCTLLNVMLNRTLGTDCLTSAHINPHINNVSQPCYTSNKCQTNGFSSSCIQL